LFFPQEVATVAELHESAPFGQHTAPLSFAPLEHAPTATQMSPSSANPETQAVETEPVGVAEQVEACASWQHVAIGSPAAW